MITGPRSLSTIPTSTSVAVLSGPTIILTSSSLGSATTYNALLKAWTMSASAYARNLQQTAPPASYLVDGQIRKLSCGTGNSVCEPPSAGRCRDGDEAY